MMAVVLSVAIVVIMIAMVLSVLVPAQVAAVVLPVLPVYHVHGPGRCVLSPGRRPCRRHAARGDASAAIPPILLPLLRAVAAPRDRGSRGREDGGVLAPSPAGVVAPGPDGQGRRGQRSIPTAV